MQLRIFSMGVLHHAMTGIGGVAIAEARAAGGQWVVSKAPMSRSARRLMEGWIRVPPS